MAKKGIYQRYESVTKKQKILKDKAYNNSITEYVTKDQRQLYLSTAQGYNGLTSQGNINWVNPSQIPIWYSSSTGGNSNSLSLYLTYGNTGYYVYSSFLTYCQWQRETVEWIFSTSRIINVEDESYYAKGTYLNDIIADYGSLPTDGRHTDGYWYVFVKMASDLKCNVSGIWKDAPTGFANVNGIWKPQSELKSYINGIYK